MKAAPRCNDEQPTARSDGKEGSTARVRQVGFDGDAAPQERECDTPGDDRECECAITAESNSAPVEFAAINAIFIATTTATDARHTLAIARALGATRNQISAGIIAAGLLAALPASILGIPAGIALVHAVGHGTRQTTPPALWLVGAVAGTLIAIAALTLIPARLSARRPIASILQAELA